MRYHTKGQPCQFRLSRLTTFVRIPASVSRDFQNLQPYYTVWVTNNCLLPKTLYYSNSYREDVFHSESQQRSCGTFLYGVHKMSYFAC